MACTHNGTESHWSNSTPKPSLAHAAPALHSNPQKTPKADFGTPLNASTPSPLQTLATMQLLHPLNLPAQPPMAKPYKNRAIYKQEREKQKEDTSPNKR